MDAIFVLCMLAFIIGLHLALPGQLELVLELISEAVGILVSIVGLLQLLIPDLHLINLMALDGFQQVRPLLSIVALLLRLIRICRRICSICIAREPVVVADDHQNKVPLNDAEADAANGQNDEL